MGKMISGRLFEPFTPILRMNEALKLIIYWCLVFGSLSHVIPWSPQALHYMGSLRAKTGSESCQDVRYSVLWHNWHDFG